MITPPFYIENIGELRDPSATPQIPIHSDPDPSWEREFRFDLDRAIGQHS
jgi:hypothetical protein